MRLDGVDVFQWAREEVGEFIGYLSQQPELFIGTVRENIARMQEGCDEEVIAAANLAGAHEMILALPNGYDTPMINGGRGLSGGQRQQITLARALFGLPPLIVLDEPSSSLDSRTKQKFVETLGELKKLNKSVVVITHQMDLLQLADKILILQEGAIYLYGPREKVLEQLKKVSQKAGPQQDTPVEGQPDE